MSGANVMADSRVHTDLDLRAQISAARKREARARAAGLRAISVRYSKVDQRVVMEMTNGG